MRKSIKKVSLKKKLAKDYADMVEAPTFYPSEEDFKDPLEYFEIVKPIAQKFGICRVVPPPSFKVCICTMYYYLLFNINTQSVNANYRNLT